MGAMHFYSHPNLASSAVIPSLVGGLLLTKLEKKTTTKKPLVTKWTSGLFFVTLDHSPESLSGQRKDLPETTMWWLLGHAPTPDNLAKKWRTLPT